MKPNLNDVGIIGQRIPHFDIEACKGCKKCAIEAACPNKVAKVVDGKLHIDEELCRHCGRCVGKCPFHSIPDGTYGFKIYIGGRWGKKISHGKALNRIFTSEEEALDVIEKAILLFKDQGLKGERFAETIERIGFENAEKQLLEKNLLKEKWKFCPNRDIKTTYYISCLKLKNALSNNIKFFYLIYINFYYIIILTKN